MVNFKVITQSSAGTPTKFGGDDLDKTHNYLNGGVGFEPVTLRSETGFEDSKLFIEDPLTGHKVYLRIGSLTETLDFFIPVGSGEVLNPIKNVFLNEQTFNKWVKLKKITPPPTPDVNHLVIWADQASGMLMAKDHTDQAIPILSEIAAIQNAGLTGISIYDSKVGSTAFLRSLSSLSSALLVTHDDPNNSVAIDIDPSQILLSDIGGSLLLTQLPTLGVGNLPSSVVLNNANATLQELIKFDKHLQLKLQTSHPVPDSGYVAFYAKDDGKLYFKNSSGTLFTLLYDTDLGGTVPLPDAGRISGHWDGTGVAGVGLLNRTESVEDIARVDYHDLTTGQFGQEWGSDSDDAGVGLRTTNTNVVYRDVNPVTIIRFGVDVAGVSNQTQIFIGWSSDTSEGRFDDDEMLDGIHGIGLGKRSTDTNFQIIRNDGGGTQTVDNPGSFLPAPDALIHTLKIIGDNENDRWGMSWDNGAVTYVTNNDPIEERKLGFAAFICPEGASTNIRKLRLLDISLSRLIK